ncbi:ABC transporter permease [Adhaeribacter aquaticus]|uniref:ABC transporter permease n=1 Tax=Adhaeribacter aquaticus TaxID=299567 RepID=UPI0004112EF5|nr:ABC transporter permease [Adhaeribacter aquaticus]
MPSPLINKFLIPNWQSKLALLYLSLFALFAIGANWLPLNFSPNDIDLDRVYQPPFQWESTNPLNKVHWLGTDQLGRDLLANIVFGARTAMLVSVPAMVLATLVGVFFGGVAGYFGDQEFKLSIAFFPSVIIALGVYLYFGFCIIGWLAFYTQADLFVLHILAGLFSLILYFLLLKLFLFIHAFQKRIFLPVDTLVMKTVELVQSVPRLLLVLCLAAFVTPSLGNIVLLSALTYWPAIARLMRGEMIKIKALPYIEAAKSLGFSNRRILVKHAFPNVLTPIVVAFTFGLINLIGLEATLSFLGIGIPADVPSWGRAIVGVRMNFMAWWLVFFPGMVLCVTVLALQKSSHYLLHLLNPRSE